MTPSRSLCLRLAALAATLATKELAKWGISRLRRPQEGKVGFPSPPRALMWDRLRSAEDTGQQTQQKVICLRFYGA
jgi:hypothetical protein